MNSFLQKFNKEQFTYYLIFLIGILLFSYNIFETSLNPDELSAIERSNFSSLSDLFKFSISTDSHPPLIQILLYYWTKLFGKSSFIVKLPFLLMAIFSIPLMYRLATEWFSKNVALLSLSFFISIQFTVMYAQMARPYISGLFLALLCALCWNKLLNNKVKTSYYVFYILSAVLLSYNHYYGTIQVFTIGVVGLFFIKRNNLLNYFIANTMVLILFLAYLPYLLIQMNVEGLTYIGKPQLMFIIDFLFYIFQFSYPSILLVSSIIILSIVIHKKKAINKFTLIAFLFFVLPFFIGFIYSITMRPIMLYRSLIHGTPFLILFLFSFSANLKKQLVLLCCSLILIINIYSLIQNRDYYNVAQKGIAKAGILNTVNLINDGNTPTILFNIYAFNLQYYYNLYGADFQYTNMYKNVPIPKAFKKTVKSITNKNIVTLNLPLNLVSIINEDFPYYQFIDYGYNFNYYVFSKDPIPNQPTSLIDTSLTFNKKDNLKNIAIDSISNNSYYQFHNLEEWGPSLTIPLGKIIPNSHQIIKTNVSILPSSNTFEGSLVFEIKDDNNLIVWRAEESKNWINNSNDWQNIHYSIQLNNLVTPDQITSNTILSIYYWNKSKTPVAIDNLSISIQEGNKLIYSFFEKIPK